MKFTFDAYASSKILNLDGGTRKSLACCPCVEDFFFLSCDCPTSEPFINNTLLTQRSFSACIALCSPWSHLRTY